MSPGWPSQLRTFHAKDSLKLKTTNSGTIPLHELAQSVLEPFTAHPLLFNGHLQTAWTVASRAHIPVYYGRRIMTGTDGGTFTVDFAVEESDEESEGLPERTRFLREDELKSQGSDDRRPMIVALHGLSGGSHELYLRAVLQPLIKQGWDACCVNARGCANSKITTHQLFNARFTNDVREVVQFLRKIYPNRPLYAVGFSLGANILTNYMGEEGKRCQFKAAAICSNPWKLEVSSLGLTRSFIGKEVYSRVMGASLKQLVEQHADVLVGDPKFSLEAVRNVTYLYEFDRELTAKVFDYPSLGAYYRDASSIDRIFALRVPSFIVHAEDDPIAGKESIPYEECRASPYTFMAATSQGGHLSWFEPNGDRWFARMVVNFFLKFEQEVESVIKPDYNPQFQFKSKL